MSSGRFRRLEMEPDAGSDGPDAGPRPAEPAGGAFHRALEVEGRLGLDESGSPHTHFCRGCGAENPQGARACFSCGGALGGPDQAAFDARTRAERAARRAAAAPQEARGAPSPSPGDVATPSHPGHHPIPSGTDGLLQEILRESEQRHDPGFGSILASGVLFASLFALVWIPVRTALALGSGGPLRVRGLLELGIAALGALWLRRRYRRELDGL